MKPDEGRGLEMGSGSGTGSGSKAQGKGSRAQVNKLDCAFASKECFAFAEWVNKPNFQFLTYT